MLSVNLIKLFYCLLLTRLQLISFVSVINLVHSLKLTYWLFGTYINISFHLYLNSVDKSISIELDVIYYAKPQVSLTSAKLRPLCASFNDCFGYFLDAIAKAKKLIRKSIAQNLKQVSLTKSFLALAMAFNLLLSNLT